MNESNLWHQIQLPSLGRYYSKCPNGVVEITSWTTAQEEEIVRHSQDPSGSSLVDKLLKGNVRFPAGFNYEDLLIIDQHFILMKLRSVSITCFYTVEYVCPECKTRHEVQHDIDKLPVKNPDDSNVWDEPFKVTLPRCKRTVGFRHLRVKDEQAITSYANTKTGPVARDVLSFRFAKKIVSIEGVEGLKFDEKRDFVKSLQMLDFEIFRDAASQVDFGIDDRVEIRCPSCKYSDEAEIPIQLGFFRPCRADLRAAVGVDKEDGGGD